MARPGRADKIIDRTASEGERPRDDDRRSDRYEDRGSHRPKRTKNCLSEMFEFGE
jgi:hypothetical protein